MMKNFFRLLSVATATLVVGCGSGGEQETPSNTNLQVAPKSSQAFQASSVSSLQAASSAMPQTLPEFQSEVNKVMTGHCAGCHDGAEWVEYSEPDHWLDAKTANGKPLLNLAKPADSLLLTRLEKYRGQSPVVGNLSLDEQSVAMLAEWVEMLAEKFPDLVASSSVASSEAASASDMTSSQAMSVSSAAGTASSNAFSAASSVVQAQSSQAVSSVAVSSVLTQSSSVASAVSSLPSTSSSAAQSSQAQTSSVAPARTAIEIIEQECASCHQPLHDNWVGLDADAWLALKSAVTRGPLIDQANPANSYLLQRIRGYGETAAANMPPANSAPVVSFDAADIAVIKDWVESITQDEVGGQSSSSEQAASSLPLASSAPMSSSSAAASSMSAAQSSAVTGGVASSTASTSLMAESSSAGVSSAAVQSSLSTSSVQSSLAVSSEASSAQASSDAASESSASEDAQSSAASSSDSSQRTALQILAQECTSCHSTFHEGWSGFTEADWLNANASFVDEPLIDVLNPAESLLLRRMTHYGGAQSNMPPADAMPAPNFAMADYEAVRDWVLDLVPMMPNSSSQASVSSSESQQSSSEASTSSSEAVSSAEASSSSAAAVSSAQSSASSIDTTQAIGIIQNYCASCHFGSHESWKPLLTDNDWRRAQSRSGESYIDPLDPEKSLLLRRISFYGEKDSTMPTANASQTQPFTRAHYDTLVSWAKTFAVVTNTPVGDGDVSFESVSLTEQGLRAELSCEQDTDLTLSIRNPKEIGYAAVDSYQGVTSRELGQALASADSLVTTMDDGTFWLRGEGADIWADAMYFNALRTEIVDGQLDMTLDVQSVTGVTHDFAKVGLLVSDSADLSGQMVFVHWSGRHGVAEDSGVGVLNNYRLIEENPIEGSVTPAPARIRIAYQNDTLKVGACLGCDSPAIGAPKSLDFKPTYAFVVASSHEIDGSIQARLGLADAYSVEGQYQEVYQQTVACSGGSATWVVPSSDVALDFERLFVEAYANDDLVASSSVVQTFTEAASCEIQEELLAPKLRRLSEQQVRNSIESVFGEIFANDIWPDLEDGARLIGMNSTADKLNINNLNFERLYEMVKSVSATLLSEQSLTTCINAASSDCVTQWVSDYGIRLWRRPLTSAEVEGLNGGIATFTTNEQRLAFAIHSLLLSSNFYFRSEIGSLNDGLAQLTNYEMVSLLSYALVNTTPDDVLLALAEQSEPLSSEQLRAQAERLLALPAANSAMVSVYKDYLKLDLVLSRPKADYLGFNDQVRADVLASAELTLADKIAENQSITDVFLGDSFYVNSNIAYLFGTTTASANLTEVSLSGSERQGLLNHPAFLAVHSTLATSGIVKRGVFTLEQLLCQELPDPPGDVMPQPIPEGVNPETTSERDLLQITHSAQTACIGCHQVIDPAGFGFENFDVIGRYRTVEKDNVPINASGSLSNIGETTLAFNNSAEYANVLAGSTQMRACVSRRFLESFLGQDVSMQSCEVKKYQRLLSEEGGNVLDLLYALIELESFSKRQIAQ